MRRIGCVRLPKRSSNFDIVFLFLFRFFSVYGCVQNGVWKQKDAPAKNVRIKMIQSNASEEDKQDLKMEAEVLSKFFHRNVVELFGVVDHEHKVN